MGQTMPVTAQPIPVNPPEEKTDVSFIVSIILGGLLLVAITIIVMMMMMMKNRRSGDPTYDLVRSKYPNLPISMTRGVAPLPRPNPFGVRR
jgi:hypothetical protein